MPPLRRSARIKATATKEHRSPVKSAPKKAADQDEVHCWLMKSEPESRIVDGKDMKFSIDDLKNMENSISPWDGVRNYEARNLMRDKMKAGHKVLFYHSNCKNPGIAGTATIAKEAYPDYTAFDPSHPYYDPKSKKDSPKWYMVDVAFESKFKHLVSLAEMKEMDELKDMALVKRGRLSVQPVRQSEYDCILAMSKASDHELA
ncbi:hypothetical protein GGI12_004525 [Dipsacomyces acuminosporus]|nr:hypothetical protein GGI12_004525 [Dipsacomyces acuminosporus]